MTVCLNVGPVRKRCSDACTRSGGGHIEHNAVDLPAQTHEQADNILGRHLLKLNVTAPY